MDPGAFFSLDVCIFLLACVVSFRYRVKLNVGDDTGVAVFVLFDGLVRQLASQACDVLSSMVNHLVYFTWYFSLFAFICEVCLHCVCSRYVFRFTLFSCSKILKFLSIVCWEFCSL